MKRILPKQFVVSPLIGKLLWSSFWTIAGFGTSQVLRLAANVILARLLAPEIFGIMIIVNSLRTGLELLSDVGISQNIVQSRKGDDPDFCNTAWTVQLVRGIVLWLASILVAPLIAKYYGIKILGLILPVMGLILVIGGTGSTVVYLLQKKLMVGKRNAFDVFLNSIQP